uniref:Glycoside hydrolase family 5 domain-containing protein n=1 Tax=Alexandrium catenella TaxID=2925 RepID=A0A7S1RTV1_ALECA
MAADPRLKGQTTLQILDAVVGACADAGLMIVLDNHMSDADWCCGDFDENGLWYNTRWSHLQWLQAHVAMARRYSGQPWVVASELRNEVRNSIVGGLWRVATWGGGGPDDWHAAATEAGNAVLHVNRNLLIVVGGLYWGKELTGVYSLPVKLEIPQRVVYAAHCYAWSYPGAPNKYETLKARLGHDWGYIVEPNKPYTAPVFVSEFGTFSDCHHATCAYWWPDLLQYLEVGDFDWAAWHADGTNSRGGHRKFAAPTDYGVLAPDWRSPAGTGELLGALQTVQRATLGPGVRSPACDEQCADTWESGWSSGRIGAAACSTCLRNSHCRQHLTAEEWCTKTWAAQECGWTCCRAGLLGDGVCSAGHCKSRYSDKWDPLWPDGRSDSEACLHCLRDPVCRHGLSEAQWCARPWSSYHCELTCCIQGHYSPDALRPGIFL